MSQAEPGLGLHLYAQLSPLAPGPTSPLWSSVSVFYERRAISGLTPPMGASGGWRGRVGRDPSLSSRKGHFLLQGTFVPHPASSDSQGCGRDLRNHPVQSLTWAEPLSSPACLYTPGG